MSSDNCSCFCNETTRIQYCLTTPKSRIEPSLSAQCHSIAAHMNKQQKADDCFRLRNLSRLCGRQEFLVCSQAPSSAMASLPNFQSLQLVSPKQKLSEAIACTAVLYVLTEMQTLAQCSYFYISGAQFLTKCSAQDFAERTNSDDASNGHSGVPTNMPTSCKPY